MTPRRFGAPFAGDPAQATVASRSANHCASGVFAMTSRLICVNDIYAFDPNAKVNLDQFEDIIGRNFRQPKEGLGWDNSPSAHMWRTIMWPTRFL